MAEQAITRKSYTKEFKEATLARVAAGEKVPDLTKELGLKRNSINAWLRQKKQGGGIKDSRKGIHGEKFKRMLVAKYRAGHKASALGATYSVHPTSIRQWARDLVEAPAESSPVIIKKAGYIPVAQRREMSGGANIGACIAMLKHAKTKVNLDDPIHLTAMLVLATLQGKM
jgi:transposase-like protein